MICQFNTLSSVACFKIFARNDIEFDTSKELQLLIQNVYSKPKLRPLIERAISDLQFVNHQLTGYWPQPEVHFDENELADFDHSRVGLTIANRLSSFRYLCRRSGVRLTCATPVTRTTSPCRSTTCSVPRHQSRRCLWAQLECELARLSCAD